MINIPVVNEIKKIADEIKCKLKIVTGNNPTHISDNELIARRYPPIFLDKIFISPIEKINPRTPVNIKPLLRKKAEIPSAPKSLIALFVHLNHGE
jgi:hypothetical protein